MANYTGFLAPKVALFSNIGLMVADPAVAAAGRVPGDQPMNAMLNRLLSHDLPRSRWLAVVLVADAARRWRSRRSSSPAARRSTSAAKMLVFIVLVASYDLLLGYTGIVSFAHTMFFGIGAYGVAIASTQLGAELRRGARSALAGGAG